MKLRDERGAVLIVGLVMAVFLVSALYYMAGIGQTIVQRERMQDAADAAAFSAATLHARGMNLIVLINMVMAALLAILVALKLLETLVDVAIVAIAVASVWAWGLAAFIPPLEGLREEVNAAYEELRPPIEEFLEALHSLASGVRVVMPAAAQIRTIAFVSDHYKPPAKFGFVLPTSLTLPTKDGKFDELCKRAGGYVGDLVTLPLEGMLPSSVTGLVSDAIAELAKAGSSWFCGSGDSSPPSTTFRYTARYPQLPSRKACASRELGTKDNSAEKCEQAERDERAATPSSDGTCGAGCDARLFSQRAASAATDCAPQGGRKLKEFSWVERSYSQTFRMSGGRWQPTQTPPSRGRVVEQGPRPCGAGGVIGSEWNQAGAGSAVCSRIAPPLPSLAGEGAIASVNVTDVPQILGCSEDVEEKRQVKSAGRVTADSGQGGNSKVPQELADGAQLGESDFQLRSVVIGDMPSPVPERVVAVAAWARAKEAEGHGLEGSVLSKARLLGRISLAQAEFYFAVKDPKRAEREDFMWNMRWRARLRRFRAPSLGNDSGSGDKSSSNSSSSSPQLGASQGTTSLAEACAMAGAPAAICGALDLSIDDLVIH